MRARWLSLTVAGGWNPELRDLFHHNSGAYAVRDRASKRVLYVGESHTGRGWKTLQRHFQDPTGKFAKVRETFVHARPELLDAALWVTSKGARVPSKGDQKALDAQAKLIARYRKQGHELVNVDDGRAHVEALRTSGRDKRLGKGASASVKEETFEHAPEEDFFGSFAKNPPALPAPNVAAEKLAANRTPDLFTGRTRLEDGGKARRDWKGEAERLERELAACRSAPVEAAPVEPEPAPVVAPPPQVKPEGFGETDAKGQASMFKRNPARGLVTLGHLVSIVMADAKTKRMRTIHYPERGAPILAYDDAGKLHIVYAARRTGAASKASRAEYARTHWGQKGKGASLEGVELAGKAPRIGTAIEVTYATSKGADRELVNYVHEFGEGGRGAFVAPFVVGAKCANRHMVRLEGGSYVTNERGIVG